MAIDLGKLGGFFGADAASSFMSTVIWGMLVLGVVVVIAVIIRNKVKYTYYGYIYKRRQDDLDTHLQRSQTVQGKAGYFNKKGKTVFRIKFGGMPWQQIELTKLPDPNFMVGNNVYYIQLNKDNYVQAEMQIDWEGESRGLSLEPVEDDLKYGAKLDLLEKSNILDTKSSLEKVAPFVVLGLIIFAGIITMYFIQKGCAA